MHLLSFRSPDPIRRESTNLAEPKATRIAQGVSGIRPVCHCHGQRDPRAPQPQTAQAVDNSSPSTATGETTAVSPDRQQGVAAFGRSGCHEEAGGTD